MIPLPSRRLILALAATAPLFLWSAAAALAADLVILALGLVDAWRAPAPDIGRRLPARLSLGDRGTATLALHNPGTRPLRVRLTDDVAPGLERLDPEPWHRRLPGGSTADVVYRFRASARGRHVFGDIHTRVAGPLGLAWRQRRHARRDELLVLPGLAEMRRLRVLGLRERLRRAGLRNVRQRGEGRSFESLREYVRGDDPRTVDWKASARRGGLMVRQYEAERSQNVVVALDAGRMMLERLDGTARLDHAMGVALQLADVARLQGDRVGLFAFADRVLEYLPPRPGTLAGLAEAMARVEPRMVEPNYPLAFSLLRRRLGRRSLVVVFTDVIDPAASHALLAQLARSASRHLVVAVALRNPDLERWAPRPIVDDADAYRRAAAEEMLEMRAVAMARMRRAGVDGLDVDPTTAAARAVDRYLEIKYRGRL